MIINGLTMLYWIGACAFVGVTCYLWGRANAKA